MVWPEDYHGITVISWLFCPICPTLWMPHICHTLYKPRITIVDNKAKLYFNKVHIQYIACCTNTHSPSLYLPLDRFSRLSVRAAGGPGRRLGYVHRQWWGKCILTRLYKVLVPGLADTLLGFNLQLVGACVSLVSSVPIYTILSVIMQPAHYNAAR